MSMHIYLRSNLKRLQCAKVGRGVPPETSLPSEPGLLRQLYMSLLTSFLHPCRRPQPPALGQQTAVHQVLQEPLANMRHSKVLKQSTTAAAPTQGQQGSRSLAPMCSTYSDGCVLTCCLWVLVKVPPVHNGGRARIFSTAVNCRC
jgi:hypothetical protein